MVTEVCVDKSGDGLRNFWRLSSGQWSRDRASGGFRLLATSDGDTIADELLPIEVRRLVGARQDGDHAFPPEFNFNPDTGKAIPALPATDPTPWVPPFDRQDADAVRGLRITDAPLGLNPDRRHSESEDPEHALPLPPPGRYEFFVMPAPSDSGELLALAAEQGVIYLWLPVAGRWVELRQLDGGLLAESPLPHEAWRCEVVQDTDGESHFFLPTRSGIAHLRPSLLRLGYHVRHRGDAPCCGAPIRWQDEIWTPMRTSPGQLKLQALRLDGHAGSTLDIEDVPADERFAAPMATRRQVIWPGEKGRLVLELDGGGLVAQYRPWPSDTHPRFDFGAPYLSRDGKLWQACWSDAEQSYAYIRLDGRDPEVHPCSAPRTCTGQINYRLAARMKLPPWLDPDHGSDANSSAIFIPILESSVHAGVLGVRISTTDGLEATLSSRDRVHSILEIHSDQRAETRLFTLNAPTPWLGRAFIHDRKLWFYHSELTRIVGWELDR